MAGLMGVEYGLRDSWIESVGVRWIMLLLGT